MAPPRNNLVDLEKEVCMILAQLVCHVHPDIVERIQQRNHEEAVYFRHLFMGKVAVENYLFDGSACVFPGVRRYVGRSEHDKRRSFDRSASAIIDTNEFPRHLWCYLENGKGYSGPNYKQLGFGEFELAHIFAHKRSELGFESGMFSDITEDLQPHGQFTCAGNVVLLPKGMVKPTDKSHNTKAAFFKRYVELYGEAPLVGRRGFKESLVPEWYGELRWNEPLLPSGWQSNVDKLLQYRTDRVTTLLA